MVEFKQKARNYFIIGVIAETLGMNSEAAANFFKALFAADDLAIYNKIEQEPKDHTERFYLLKSHFPKLYTITDRLFSTYRRTYTQELNKEELSLVKKRVVEAFENAEVATPTNEEIKAKFEELLKKGKLFS